MDKHRKVRIEQKCNESSGFNEETRRDHDLNYNLNSSELLSELKVLLEDIYNGELFENSNSIKLSFDNGQSFLITVKSCS